MIKEDTEMKTDKKVVHQMDYSNVKLSKCDSKDSFILYPDSLDSTLRKEASKDTSDFFNIGKSFFTLIFKLFSTI